MKRAFLLFATGKNKKSQLRSILEFLAKTPHLFIFHGILKMMW